MGAGDRADIPNAPTPSLVARIAYFALDIAPLAERISRGVVVLALLVGVLLVVRQISAPHPRCGKGQLPVPEGDDAQDLGYCVGVPDGVCETQVVPSGRINGSCKGEKMIKDWRASRGDDIEKWSGSYSMMGARVGYWRIGDDDNRVSSGFYNSGLAGEYDHGERVGTWSTRDPADDTLLRLANYRNGQLEGRDTRFCGNGWIYEDTFSGGKLVAQELRRNEKVIWRRGDKPLPEEQRRQVPERCGDSLPR